MAGLRFLVAVTLAIACAALGLGGAGLVVAIAFVASALLLRRIGSGRTHPEEKVGTVPHIGRGAPDRTRFARRPKTKPRHDLDELAERLGVPAAELRAFRPGYTTFAIAKRSGGRRTITAPDPATKALQRRILLRLLARLPAHPAVHGFERGRSIVTNAAVHVDPAVRDAPGESRGGNTGRPPFRCRCSRILAGSAGGPGGSRNVPRPAALVNAALPPPRPVDERAIMVGAGGDPVNRGRGGDRGTLPRPPRCRVRAHLTVHRRLGHDRAVEPFRRLMAMPGRPPLATGLTTEPAG